MDTAENFIPRERQISRYVGFSLGLHASIFALLLVKSFVFPSNPLILQPTIQVDLVALPDQVKAPEQQIDLSLPVKDTPPPAAPVEEAAPDEPEPLAKEEKAKPKEDSAKDAKKALEKLKQELAKQKEVERQKMIAAEKERLNALKEKTRQALRGNQVNKGTSMTGIMGETLNAYGAHVTEVLRSNWELPTFLQQKGYRAVARIYVSGDGTIQNFSFRQNSGNESFDNYVTSAIRKSKFAPPPAEMARQLQNSGMEVIFPL